jgi:Ser/Thr protein kinase RdoA (MazF antagonist)
VRPLQHRRVEALPVLVVAARTHLSVVRAAPRKIPRIAQRDSRFLEIKRVAAWKVGPVQLPLLWERLRRLAKGRAGHLITNVHHFISIPYR